MDSEYFGAEGTTAEDRAYHGSRFSEVREALFANPYQQVWGAPARRRCPCTQSRWRACCRAPCRSGRPHLFRQATERAVDSRADLRWGPDRRGFRRLLHPNGICLTGQWEITEDTAYSGYFRQGSRRPDRRALFDLLPRRRGAATRGRCPWSASCSRRPTRITPSRCARPTSSPSRTSAASTADYINDAELRNAPNTTAWRRGLGAPILLVVRVWCSGAVDKNPTHPPALPDRRARQAGGRAHARAEFMRLAVDAGPAENRGRGARFPRRGHGADLRPRRPARRNARYVRHRGHRRRHDARPGVLASGARSRIGAASERSSSTRRSPRTTATS